jgi:hypothetical protein
VRADGVVALAPLLDHNLGLNQGVENFAVQQRIAQFAIEGFYIAILLRIARLDIGGLCADGGNPLSQCRRDEFRFIVRAEVCKFEALAADFVDWHCVLSLTMVPFAARATANPRPPGHKKTT